MSDYVKQTTVTTNAATPTFFWNGLGRQPPTIQRQDVICSGTFSSAVLTLQYSLDGGTTWVDMPADKDANLVTLSSAGVMTIKPRYPLVGLKVASGVSPSIVVTVI